MSCDEWPVGNSARSNEVSRASFVPRYHRQKPSGGGLHHISTTTQFDGTLDGHLLNSNGVVTGDYTLQIHDEEQG